MRDHRFGEFATNRAPDLFELRREVVAEVLVQRYRRGGPDVVVVVLEHAEADVVSPQLGGRARQVAPGSATSELLELVGEDRIERVRVDQEFDIGVTNEFAAA